MASDPSTKTRQYQSANGREQIVFPLGLAPFVVLALLAG
jgi:hypothetical protein